MALDHRIADVRPVGHALPVGVQPARGLAAAFDDVSGQAALRQSVVVVRVPAEFVHQRAQRDGAVHASAGDHDLRARGQGLADGQRAEVRVGREEPGGQRRAALQFGDAFLAQSGHKRHHVVALHHGDFQVQALLGGQGANRPRARLRVHAAGVADHANALLDHVAQDVPERHGDEVRRVAQLGVLGPRGGQDRTSSARPGSRTPGSPPVRPARAAAHPRCCRPRSPRLRRYARPCSSARPLRLARACSQKASPPAGGCSTRDPAVGTVSLIRFASLVSALYPRTPALPCRWRGVRRFLLHERARLCS